MRNIAVSVLLFLAIVFASDDTQRKEEESFTIERGRFKMVDVSALEKQKEDSRTEWIKPQLVGEVSTRRIAATLVSRICALHRQYASNWPTLFDEIEQAFSAQQEPVTQTSILQEAETEFTARSLRALHDGLKDAPAQALGPEACEQEFLARWLRPVNSIRLQFQHGAEQLAQTSVSHPLYSGPFNAAREKCFNRLLWLSAKQDYHLVDVKCPSHPEALHAYFDQEHGSYVVAVLTPLAGACSLSKWQLIKKDSLWYTVIGDIVYIKEAESDLDAIEKISNQITEHLKQLPTPQNIPPKPTTMRPTVPLQKPTVEQVLRGKSELARRRYLGKQEAV